mmetsp:Transcript_3762/g.13310  ORF Transcript_3762/g.13310 Transcript_3762/m.13310 type:complete len:238 (-) Transcript_3762:1121-1834(-)
MHRREIIEAPGGLKALHSADRGHPEFALLLLLLLLRFLPVCHILSLPLVIRQSQYPALLFLTLRWHIGRDRGRDRRRERESGRVWGRAPAPLCLRCQSAGAPELPCRQWLHINRCRWRPWRGRGGGDRGARVRHSLSVSDRVTAGKAQGLSHQICSRAMGGRLCGCGRYPLPFFLRLSLPLFAGLSLCLCLALLSLCFHSLQLCLPPHSFLSFPLHSLPLFSLPLFSLPLLSLLLLQ